MTKGKLATLDLRQSALASVLEEHDSATRMGASAASWALALLLLLLLFHVIGTIIPTIIEAGPQKLEPRCARCSQALAGDH